MLFKAYLEDFRDQEGKRGLFRSPIFHLPYSKYQTVSTVSPASISSGV